MDEIEITNDQRDAATPVAEIAPVVSEPQAEADETPQQEPQAETPEEAATEEPQPEDGAAAMARALAEAEQRGYLRGRNEAVALAMQGERMWEQAHAAGETAPPVRTESESDALFLRHIRPSIWD